MVRSLPWGLLGMSLLCTLLFNAPAEAQNQGQTVRRHRVAEDENYVPALAKAEAALEAKDYATAEQQLKSVVASQPGSFRAWFNLGLVYGETNRPAEAIEAYRKASAADPKSFESQLNLGLLLA
ncbi:MAG: tetratricopeptide repeat protein, partial [Candidatus Korobacteraceae bacterium]